MTSLALDDFDLDLDYYESDARGSANCPRCRALVRRGAPHDCERFIAYRARLRRSPGGSVLDDVAAVDAEIAARTRR